MFSFRSNENIHQKEDGLIKPHMINNNLFATEQHGFITGKSCTIQLLEYMEDITQAVDNGDDVGVIYLDFCKAFNRVPYTRLLLKLHGYRIRGSLNFL